MEQEEYRKEEKAAPYGKAGYGKRPSPGY